MCVCWSHGWARLHDRHRHLGMSLCYCGGGDVWTPMPGKRQAVCVCCCFFGGFFWEGSFVIMPMETLFLLLSRNIQRPKTLIKNFRGTILYGSSHVCVASSSGFPSLSLSVSPPFPPLPAPSLPSFFSVSHFFPSSPMPHPITHALSAPPVRSASGGLWGHRS